LASSGLIIPAALNVNSSSGLGSILQRVEYFDAGGPHRAVFKGSLRLDAVCGKHCLDIVPQRLVYNRRVLPGIGIAFVWYLAADGRSCERPVHGQWET
jgi:hypothetical protein